MSGMMEELEADAKKEKKDKASKEKSQAKKDAKAKKSEISAENGEHLIKGDAASIYEFSDSIA